MPELLLSWPEWIKPSVGLPIVQWSILIALAAAAGYMLQRHLGLPRVLGYSAIGALAGFSGFTVANWPLQGTGLFMVELGLSVMLFEAGGRLTLRWFRHNPMLLAQSLAESVVTYAAAYWLLVLMDVSPTLRAPLALVSVAVSPAILMRVAIDLRSSGPVTERSIALASLNTLYVLTLGGVMARFLGRNEFALIGAAWPIAALLGISIAFGAALALALRGALLLMKPTSENTAVLLLALVATFTTLAASFGGSAPLAALLAGIVLKALSPRPWSWPRQFGIASAILTMLMFVLVSLVAAQADWQASALGLIILLALTRILAKFLAVAAASFGSGASLRQSLWTASALWPMSAVALLLVSQFTLFAPSLGGQIAIVALPLILLMEVLGALMTTTALRQSREISAPTGLRRPPTTEEKHDGT